MRDAGEAAFDEFFGSYPTSLLVEVIYSAMRAQEIRLAAFPHIVRASSASRGCQATSKGNKALTGQQKRRRAVLV